MHYLHFRGHKPHQRMIRQELVIGATLMLMFPGCRREKQSLIECSFCPLC
jgi:hypothetical protein